MQFASVVTLPTFDTRLRVDDVFFLNLARNRIGRADASAHGAPDATIRIDAVLNQLLAFPCEAFAVIDMPHHFIHKVAQHRLDGIGRRLT